MSNDGHLSTPYDVLVGTEIQDGWRIVSKTAPGKDATGGHFSVGFNLERSDGKQAFCKVIDMREVLTAPQPMKRMLEISGDFEHEVSSLEACNGAQLRRVILALASSSAAQPGLPMDVLSYIVFERAEGDIRLVLPATGSDTDLVLRFALLHDAALGIGELHQLDIAHQDIKPSNILAVVASDGGPMVGKVSDLGRATVANRPHRFDGLVFPGDWTYAPPEYWYGYVPQSEEDRRRGTDLYQLGSLIAFVISGSSMPALVRGEVDPAFAPGAWSGEYSDIEPFLQEATEQAVDIVLSDTPEWAAPLVRELITALCDPDFTRRNALSSGAAHVSRFNLQRVISSLDRLQKLALLKTKATA